MFEVCIKNFAKSLKNKMEILECNEDGSPKENLMKYHLHLKFKEYIEKTKIKMSDLLTESFCKEVIHNILQYNSDNISILEDNVAFNILINPKIIKILSDFEPTISEIFDYMNKQIYPIIETSFGNYKKFKSKIEKIFSA